MHEHNDLISKSEFLTSLLSCGGIPLKAVDIINEKLESYKSSSVNEISAYLFEDYCEDCKEKKKLEKELNEYKYKYQVAKTGLTEEERNTLIELICHEQLKYLIPNGKHETNKYIMLEALKSKIRII